MNPTNIDLFMHVGDEGQLLTNSGEHEPHSQKARSSKENIVPVTVLTTLKNGSASSPPSEDNIQDVDHDIVNDFESVIGELNAASSGASSRPTTVEYVEENGRTYHRYKQGKYPLPNDGQEQDRLGTGIWAIEFAEKNPLATVVGTDLSPIQPLHVPPNCRFEVDDAEDEWAFRNFDFIHSRAIMSCFADPKSVFQQAFNALSPGGYFEVQDGEFPVKYIGAEPTESAFYKWTQIIAEGAAKSGRPWTNASNYASWMREIGFEGVVEKKFYWPTSQWPKGKHLKEISFYFQDDILRSLEGMSLKVMKYVGWSNEEIQAFLPKVRNDIKNTSLLTYFDITVVYGRKPITAARE